MWNVMRKNYIKLSEQFPKSNRKIVERGQIHTPSIHIHDHPLSWLGTGTSIKNNDLI